MYQFISGWQTGERQVLPFDFRDNPDAMKERLWIGQQDVEIDFPDVDTRQMQIDAFEAQVDRERADCQARVNLLLDRIGKLRAIGC
jgi:hypothetical protein